MADASALAQAVSAAKTAVKQKYKRGVGSISASDLQVADIKPPTWVIPDMLPQGLAILCASSKVGKSWMSLQMCLAISRGKDFLGVQTNTAGCLYLALEDSLYRLKDRMTKMTKTEKAPRNLYLAIKVDGMDGALLKQLDEELEEQPDIKLIIIDTFQKVRGTSRKSETAYAADYREVGALKAYADDHNLCILIVHHLRKMADEDDVFNMISGSNGIMGLCDEIYIIYKQKRQDEEATFKMTGRDIRQRDIVIRYDEPTYTWEAVASTEDEQERRKKRDYESNLLVQTVKELLKVSPLGWKGTATDLLKAVYDVTGNPYAASSTGLGKATETKATVKVDYDKSLRYGTYVELGARGRAANPFLRNAVDENIDQINAAIVSEISKTVGRKL